MFFLLAAAPLVGSLQQVQERLYSSSSKGELVAPENRVWMHGYDEALSLAQEQKKPVIVAFLGTSWCPWSDKLSVEVLNQGEFIRSVKERFILVSLSVPEEGEKKEELQERFQIDQLPILILFDENGEEVSKVGYLPKSGEEFGKELTHRWNDYRMVKSAVCEKELCDFSAKELQQLYVKTAKLSCSQLREKIYLAGLKAKDNYFFLLEQYRHCLTKGKRGADEALAVRKKLQAKDPKNREGVQREIALIDFASLSSKPFKKKEDVKNVLLPLVSYVEKFGKEDSEHLWEIELSIAQYLFGKGRATEALLYARAAFSHAPSAEQASLLAIVNHLESFAKK